ncbi:MAG: acyclic terpene utilization AtuA family protein [Armatimonadetes bacterium]|nr:acyclic terpene utilization AtuA family protein [Armatimonadota bacterium]
MEEVRVAIPISAVGYGINEDTLKALMARDPHVVAADAGSTDSGPYYLGSGHSNKARASVKRDLRLMLTAARAHRVPLVIGNAGTSGARPHHEWMLQIVREIAREEGLSFRLAVVWAEQDKSFVHARLAAGNIRPLPGVHPLTPAHIDACVHIVAQMGVEPYLRALDAGADVVLAGRSCDTSIIASYPIWRGADPALALHMAKITECGALCAYPSTGRDGIMGVVREGDFLIETPNPARTVTPFSVAAHMIYEVEHPYLQEEPGGTQDFSAARVEQAGERAVRITGSRFTPRARPTLKLEGSAVTGYRSFLIGGTRDPFLIKQIDYYVEGVTAEVHKVLGDLTAQCRIDWKVYGRDAVMGGMEPTPTIDGAHELGLLVQVLAPTQEIAHDVCTLIEGRMIGFPYPGAKTRTAHIAFPFSPLIHDSGPVYRFDVFHLTEVDRAEDLERIFPLELITL